MKSKVILLASLVLLLFSCTKEGFTVYSTMLYRNIEIDGEKRSENIVIETAVEESGSDGKYTYLLLSPSGDLKWEGKLSESDGYYISDALLLTPGALYEEGEYTLYIYSDSGTDEKLPVTLEKEEGEYTYGNAVKKDDAVITYYDSDNNAAASPDNAVTVEISYTDRYSNRIKLKLDYPADAL